ncbi:MAG TPA: hypothetical protein VF669_00575 [Tepidisphaeraceae bacterium]|jgi:uncharacterized delta-60 repeat protein
MLYSRSCRGAAALRARKGFHLSGCTKAVIEQLERRQLLSAAPLTHDVADLTAVTTTGAIVSTDPALGGPIQFPFANGQPKEQTTQPDGKRLVAGYVGGNWAIARYQSDGSLDATFGGDGKITIDLGTPSDRAMNISLRPDGKILLLGVTAGSGSAWQFAVVRLNANGSTDTTFANGGKLLSGLGRALTYGGVATVLKDGRIHITGFDGEKSVAMEYDANGHNGFDRMANLPSRQTPMQAQALAVADGAGPVASSFSLLAASPFFGPVYVPPATMHAQSDPQVDEGSSYQFDLSYGEDWLVKWDSGQTQPESQPGLLDHVNHVYVNGLANHTISATSENINLAAGEAYETPERHTVLHAKHLSISSAARLDLQDNDLIVDSGNFASLASLRMQGYRSGLAAPDSTATGIVSTVGQTWPFSPILALFDNAAANFDEWPLGSGINVGASAVLGKFAYLGDADLNGMVTGDDYSAIDSNLGSHVGTWDETGGMSWFAGDWNVDGDITPDDYSGVNLGAGESGDALVTAGEAPVLKLTGNVTVNNVPPSVTIVADRTSVAPGQTAHLTAVVDDPGTDTHHYHWSVGGEPVGDDTNTFDAEPATLGDVVVTVTVSDGDATGTDSVTIHKGLPPEAPSNLSASAVSSSAINLAWSSQTPSADTIQIFISGDGTNYSYLDEVPATQTTYQATDLDASSQYWFKVRAMAYAISSEMSSASYATTGEVAKPTAFRAEVLSPTRLNLVWNQVEGAGSYQIDWASSGHEFQRLASVGADETEYLLSSPQPGATYSFRIRAVADNGVSLFAAPVTATVPAQAPPALNWTRVAGGVALTWSEVAGATHVVVERTESGTTNWVRLATLEQPASTYTDRSLNKSTTYEYRVGSETDGVVVFGGPVKASMLPVAPTLSFTYDLQGYGYINFKPPMDPPDPLQQIERSRDGVSWTYYSAAIYPKFRMAAKDLAGNYWRVKLTNGVGTTYSAAVRDAGAGLHLGYNTQLAVIPDPHTHEIEVSFRHTTDPQFADPMDATKEYVVKVNGVVTRRVSSNERSLSVAVPVQPPPFIEIAASDGVTERVLDEWNLYWDRLPPATNEGITISANLTEGGYADLTLESVGEPSEGDGPVWGTGGIRWYMNYPDGGPAELAVGPSPGHPYSSRTLRPLPHGQPVSIYAKFTTTPKSNVVTLVPEGLPVPIPKLTRLGRNGLRLDWTVDGDYGVQVELSQDGENFVPLENAPGTSLVFRNLPTSTTYSFRLRTIWTAVYLGYSNYSEVVAARLAAIADIEPHRTRMRSGEPIPESTTSQQNSDDYVILTNNNFDEHPNTEQRDLDDVRPLLPAAGEVGDPDLARITLKKIPAEVKRGRLKLSISDETSVRILTKMVNY